MPMTERPTEPVRGHKTICIPCSQQEYEQVVDDPERFPAEIRRGYRMKDVYHPRKTGYGLRRIELRNLQCYLVRPSFLMPYLSGRTEDAQAPLFSASSPSRSGP
jgi:hypothetical protein